MASEIKDCFPSGWVVLKQCSAHCMLKYVDALHSWGCIFFIRREQEGEYRMYISYLNASDSVIPRTQKGMCHAFVFPGVH